MHSQETRQYPWACIAIDTGGTFTDACLARLDTPNDVPKVIGRVKVLSNAALRGRIKRRTSDTVWALDLPMQLPPGFLCGFRIAQPGTANEVLISEHDEATNIVLAQPLPLQDGDVVELIAPCDAPRLAICLLLGTTPTAPLGANDHEIAIRLATTRGTNALLEGTGQRFAMVLDKGLEDLLAIGDQSREDLFTLDVTKCTMAPTWTVGIGGRLRANGEPDNSNNAPFSEDDARAIADQLHAMNIHSLGVALVHAWRTPEREAAIVAALQAAGVPRVIGSTNLSRAEKLLPRAETTAVEATLAGILEAFVDEVLPETERASTRISIQSSGGGLLRAEEFHAKDGLLSGPAGGLIGAANVARANGFSRVLGFDMGGTSTDVSRFDGQAIYRFETRVGPARIQAPCLAIDSVAAGGGSICSLTAEGLTVGPRSAGASPGPACYGAGGPLTITDVNVLLGRADPARFAVPISVAAAEVQLTNLREALRKAGRPDPGRQELLLGLLDIANERMAEAIGSMALHEGVEPGTYALVPFGGAGGQHGCAIANALGIDTILAPKDAGILSAHGVLAARHEQFAERTVLKPLSDDPADITSIVRELEAEAREAFGQGPLEVTRRIAALQLEGQDAVIQLDADDAATLRSRYEEAFSHLFGYEKPDRPIELAWIRVAMAEPTRHSLSCTRIESAQCPAQPSAQQFMVCAEGTRNANVFDRAALHGGQGIEGPAIVVDDTATVVIDEHWHAIVQDNGALLIRRDREHLLANAAIIGGDGATSEELVAARLGAIARGMGELLRRTALSVNVRDRLDYSCAILSADGQLLVNAPHMPIHLGSMGLAVRETIKRIEAVHGDVLLTNDPACGGAHLPDVTAIAAVFDPDDRTRRIGFVAVRAHHAEIGGTHPGSTPPFAHTLHEEGVCIQPMQIVSNAGSHFDEFETLLREHEWPSRRPEENLADAAAEVAAVRHGVARVEELAHALGPRRYSELAAQVSANAATASHEAIATIGKLEQTVEETLDDGSLIRLHVACDGERLRLDFSGSAPTHSGNFNAPVAIVTGAVVYVMRLLADRKVPMNEGLLDPVDLVVPEGMLNPQFSGDAKRDPAVCAGNTETSQRIVDALVKAFALGAASQGTMNNFLLGNDHFGYYETVAGGAGATENADGCSAVHTHMTNTRMTDPEVLERRYPVVLERFAIRQSSGGAGAHRGGDGVVRRIRALADLTLSIVAQNRTKGPLGAAGGSDGQPGKAHVERATDGSIEQLGSSACLTLEVGDVIEVQTPGGGGFGQANGARVRSASY